MNKQKVTINTRPTCELCARDLERLDLPFPCFRHVDFTTVYERQKGWICHDCDLLQKIDTFKRESNIFAGELYGKSGQTVHTLVDSNGQERTRSECQADLIVARLPDSAKACLDIGCFDGALLAALKQRRRALRCVGVDPNIGNGQLVVQRGMEFLTSLNSAERGLFDVVVLSHSIMYVDKLLPTLDLIRDLLKPSGFVYCQLPDLRVNPLYGLMGDQSYILSEHGLANALKKSGLGHQRINHPDFNKEMVLTAQRDSASMHAKALTPDYSIDQSLRRDIGILKQSALAALRADRVFVLGTTITAAFVHQLLPRNVIGFVDENKNKSKLEFRGLPVRHPGELTSHDQVFVPNDPSGSITSRLATLYPAIFFSGAMIERNEIH